MISRWAARIGLGGTAGRNRVTGGQAPWPAAVDSPERAVRAYGSPNGPPRAPVSSGGRRGSRPCRFGGRERRQARWPPWPATMARGACGQGTGSQQNEKRRAWEERGEYGESHRGENRSGGGSVTAGRAEVRSAAGGASPCGGCGQERGENWSGGSRGRARGARLLFVAAGREGGAPMMHGAWAAVAQTPGAGSCRAA